MVRRITVMFICTIFLLTSMPIFAGPDDYNNEEVLKTFVQTKVDDLHAKASVLIDIDSGRVLLEKNMNEKLPIASVTKVMTSLVIMEALDSRKIKLDTMIPVTPDAVAMGGSQVYLKEGEMFSVNEMLKCIFVHSANDACVAMADALFGSEAVFVSEMNKRAKELGMVNTNFLDCTGLTDDGHYSSARDISIMSRELIKKHPKAIEYSTIWMDTIRDGKFRLDNTNKLVKYYEGTTGLKTGFTSKAGYCLSASAKRGNLSIIAVVLGEPDTNTRFAEVKRLLDHGFANYRETSLLKKGDDMGVVPILYGVPKEIKVVAKESLSPALKSDEKNNVVKNVIFNNDITAPLEAGTKVGEVRYKIGNDDIGSVDLVTSDKVEKASFLRLIMRKIALIMGLQV